MFSVISTPTAQRTFSLDLIFVLVGATAVAGCILVPEAGLVVVGGCVALWFLALVVDAVRGSLDGILLCYALAFPFGYCLLSFPREHSIVTLDRVVILGAFMGLFLVKPGMVIAVPKTLRWAGLAWLAFIVIAGFTLGKSPSPMNEARILVDGFLLPLLLGWCVIARFDVRRQLPTLHTAVCISSILCVVIAAAEVVTGQDLLPTESSAIFFAGSIARPNGPFESNDTLALVGAVSFFFVLFLRAALGPKLSAGRRILHSIGLTAAIGMALMPLFRSVAITLLLALVIDTLWEQRTSGRACRVVLMLASVGLIFISKVFAPDMFEDRSKTENIYGRLAQFEQNLRVFADYPVLGVGFQNFNNFVVGDGRYLASYNGVSSLDWTHNTLAQILTETGILGFVPYVMAHFLLLRAMWQLRQSSSSGHLAWKYYVYLFLSYWVTGLTESSGFSPLNLWYMFATAVFSKYALTAPDLGEPLVIGSYERTGADD
jgi:O-antigen ligase/polysaccharide polymerase Wzy-like membrane protein